ncbi:MAG: flagellar export protein FliJ [Pseudomonadales bacterium]
MKKPRSKRMKVVLDLEARKKQQADQFLAQHVQRVQTDQVQLQQLESYLDEYQRQYQQACSQGISIQSMTTYQAFLAKVSSAIVQHKAAMKVNQQHLEKVREFWTKTYARHKAVGSLVDKFKEEELAAADKATQKMIDEASQQQFARRASHF